MRVEINECLFKQMIDSVKHATEKGYRKILEFIKICVKRDTITAYTLDGYRASKFTIKCDKNQNEDEFECYIKPLAVKKSKRGLENVTIELVDEKAIVKVPTEFGELQYSFKQPTEKDRGANVDLEQIYKDNKPHDREVALNARYMVDAFKALASVDCTRNHMAVFESKEGELKPIIVRSENESVICEQLIVPIRREKND
jgi:DNA polymerase III sliding clamp (beta) subunit (PCNA family)